MMCLFLCISTHVCHLRRVSFSFVSAMYGVFGVFFITIVMISCYGAMNYLLNLVPFFLSPL